MGSGERENLSELCRDFYLKVYSAKLGPPTPRLPTPDSRLPVPCSPFPIPDSRFPIPDSPLRGI